MVRSHVTRILFSTLLLGVCLLVSGCLKTKITTGDPPARETVELDWAHGFVYGLVPPVNAPLAIGDRCTDGISTVYFRQSFVQVVAQGLTGSLYSPQTFTVTCAAPGSQSALDDTPSPPLGDTAD